MQWSNISESAPQNNRLADWPTFYLAMDSSIIRYIIQPTHSPHTRGWTGDIIPAGLSFPLHPPRSGEGGSLPARSRDDLGNGMPDRPAYRTGAPGSFRRDRGRHSSLARATYPKTALALFLEGSARKPFIVLSTKSLVHFVEK